MNKLLLALMLLTTPMVFIGCNTTNIPYKAAAITATTIDGAMNGWGDYVRAGKATPADQARVRAALNKYLKARDILADVIHTTKANPDTTAITLAEQSLAAASADLMDLVTPFLKGAK